MKVIDGIYVSEIYSILLQKNTLQLNKFLSQLDKSDWECLLEDCDENILHDALEEFDKGTHIEYFLQNFPDAIVAKVYKAKFYDFERSDSDFLYKKDYNDLFLFYKFSNDLETLVAKINEEAISLMQQEVEKEKNP